MTGGVASAIGFRPVARRSAPPLGGSGLPATSRPGRLPILGAGLPGIGREIGG